MARQAYQEQLLKLNGELIEMGDLCEEAMSLVMKALREKDEEIAVSVHKIEQKIDQKERDIEAMCMTLLLRQQPVSAGTKTAGIHSAERIGHLSVSRWRIPAKRRNTAHPGNNRKSALYPELPGRRRQLRRLETGYRK